MPRSGSIAAATIAAWLQEVVSENAAATYRHRLTTERDGGRAAALAELRAYVEDAHLDARVRIARALAPTLSPFGADLGAAEGYPESLPRGTLTGYLGEVLAGIFAEHKPIHGYAGWRVPVFLFRYHNLAFERLATLQELLATGQEIPDQDDKKQRLPGRTGNDCVAFELDASDRVVATLVCEAKCLAESREEKIVDAHKKISEIVRRPASTWELIEILGGYDTPNAHRWHAALLAYHQEGYKTTPRYDLVLYACGQTPKKKTTWIPADNPHASYTGGRDLEVVEVHLDDLSALVDAIYRAP